ncbi:(+)-neomenthol dehydrogenase [Tripterygium wilfordii]|uniref:(+)-neomenthol dehydrogenase n=1 Tax=Tripterygium wilfordii TaxID=458696 RepID=A0A7J7CFU7_TRIWF|nr:(+)-neomenthol dehydrogenase [Tripterygium wilfordii]
MAALVPRRVNKDQWSSVISHWCTTDSQGVLQEKMIENPNSAISMDDDIGWSNNDVYMEVFGPDRHGRVRGVGSGPTPSQKTTQSYITNEWAKEVLGDGEKLTEDRLEEVLREFRKDFKEGSLESNGWPTFTAAYKMSKAALNAYTRIAAKKYESFCVNCVCPGFVKTDFNRNKGTLTVEEGAESPLKLALLPKGGPSGLFFMRDEVSGF